MRAEDAALAHVRQLLDEQRNALSSGDPVVLSSATARLADALQALKRHRPGSYDSAEARVIRAQLRAQTELIARERAAVERALSALEAPAQATYGAQSSTGTGRRHVVA